MILKNGIKYFFDDRVLKLNNRSVFFLYIIIDQINKFEYLILCNLFLTYIWIIIIFLIIFCVLPCLKIDYSVVYNLLPSKTRIVFIWTIARFNNLLPNWNIYRLYI